MKPYAPVTKTLRGTGAARTLSYLAERGRITSTADDRRQAQQVVAQIERARAFLDRVAACRGGPRGYVCPAASPIAAGEGERRPHAQSGTSSPDLSRERGECGQP